MKDKPNIILIIMDAARSDHLSCYGYPRQTSPNIDKIANEGILFEQAFSTAEWSPPSHASIFTGKYPSHHGTIGRKINLDKNNLTIAEVLSKNGYNTMGITKNNLIGLRSFQKGFKDFINVEIKYRDYKFITECPKDFFRTLINGPDGGTYRVNEIIKKNIKKLKLKGKPFFLFVNFINCHAPYDPPHPYKKYFCKNFNEVPLYFLELIMNKLFKKTLEKYNDNKYDVNKLNFIATDKGQFKFMAKELDVSKQEWDIIKAWYDGEIYYLDYHIGLLINFLNKEEILDDTFIIITSDHGDNFGEKGLASHHFSLSDSIIKVPLVMRYPKIINKNSKFKNIVSLIDIYPTILDIAGIKNYSSDGVSLYPFEDRKIHKFICAESGKSITTLNIGGWGQLESHRDKFKNLDKGMKCLRTQKYKYIRLEDGSEKLYNIKIDKNENVDLSERYPKKLQHFRNLLKNEINLSYYGPDEFLNETEESIILNRLKKLGYI